MKLTISALVLAIAVSAVAACDCKADDHTCLSKCVTDANSCITGCRDDQCYRNCVNNKWPAPSGYLHSDVLTAPAATTVADVHPAFPGVTSSAAPTASQVSAAKPSLPASGKNGTSNGGSLNHVQWPLLVSALMTAGVWAVSH
ncbi:hypothetical protein J3Q64DRAFT_1827758 [Phycomyces blakesleeanus]|uniref:Uncharacterized protein n=1 Tax=Phycomyces blakesleeanus TaxID=4837 RepID=A0ABR3BEV4_PHYBL